MFKYGSTHDPSLCKQIFVRITNKCMKPLCSWQPVLPYCMTFNRTTRFHLIQSKNKEAVCDTYLQSRWKNLQNNSTNILVFWDIMLCHLASNFQHFKGLKYFRLQGQAVLLEDKGGMIPQNAGNYSPNEAASHSSWTA
jgi:hypothetical protein